MGRDDHCLNLVGVDTWQWTLRLFKAPVGPKRVINPDCLCRAPSSCIPRQLFDAVSPYSLPGRGIINQNESFGLPNGAVGGLLRQADSSSSVFVSCVLFLISLTSYTKQELLKLWR